MGVRNVGMGVRRRRACLGAGGLDRIKSIGRHRAQDADHLAITIGVMAEASPYPLDRGRKRPVLERRAIAQRAGLPRQYRYVMPGIIDRLVAPEPANMLADDLAVLADDEPISIPDRSRPTSRRLPDDTRTSAPDPSGRSRTTGRTISRAPIAVVQGWGSRCRNLPC